uniref:Uncharacterized protein n=1 Tax=Mycena chlorophos TaxID=658473 RepID=A0ABQ0M441_MYCCL|nr:predicted protein [Mycena chlorophos]
MSSELELQQSRIFGSNEWAPGGRYSVAKPLSTTSKLIAPPSTESLCVPMSLLTTNEKTIRRCTHEHPQ